VNFQQLRIIRETVRRNFNLTEVANALFTSQSGVSKHIKDLEDELGVELFVRKGKRLLGLTEPGKELVVIVERILVDRENIRKLGEQFSKRDEGRLIVATTHTQARYSLPNVVTGFKRAFPRVQLVLHQGSPPEISGMLSSGEADIGIATESLNDNPHLACFEYYSWHHGVVVPKGHPLDDGKPLTLEGLAEHPIVTYHGGFTGRSVIDETFAKAGIVPDIVMSAMDTDVLKTYVELGLGVGIIASMAFNPKRDEPLRLLPADHLFPSNTSLIAVRRGNLLRDFALRFIELASPRLTEAVVRAGISSEPAKLSAACSTKRDPKLSVVSLQSAMQARSTPSVRRASR
jgi:LysR family cys regulon transcriptional activator